MAIYVQSTEGYSSSTEEAGSHKSTLLSGFGTIKFIETVRERPEVWDSRSTAYKSKDVKTHAWKCIAASMDPDFHNLSHTEQNVAVHGWMRRWKSLRDCYTREVSRNNTKKKKYIYFDHLTFLNQVVSSKRESYRRLREYREEALKDENYMPEDLYSGDLWSGKQFLVVEEEEAPEEILSLQQLAAYHQAQQQNDDDDQPQPVAVFALTDDEESGNPDSERADDTTADDSCSQTTERNNTCDDDPDKMFLLSLIPDLKKVPPNIKLQIKSKILTIIQDAILTQQNDK